MRKIFFYITAVIFSILLFLVMSLFVMKMLGYTFNKEYFTDRNQCILDNYENQRSSSDIESCIFWMRVNYLEKEQGWEKSFTRDDAYCDSTYPKSDGFFSPVLDNMNDPRCYFGAYRGKLMRDNWDYLVSKEKDGMFNFCALQICPEQPLFK
ncbi:MAG: hypothetical protein NUW00_04425 [Candidatus Kaiserbacteria bacterium]|nr:hypothetical protein [Candidatus Kaiserbacteria bacterium]